MLLTLREVAILTRTPYSTIKRWVYTDRVLEPIVLFGPCNKPRLAASTMLAFFPIGRLG